MLRIDGATGLLVSHTPAPRKRMFEDLETAEKKFADALRKAKDAPEGKPLRDFDLD